MSAADHAATIRDLIPEPEDVGDEERATVEHAHDALAALVTQAERAVWLEDELDECDKRADKAEARADHAAIVRENLAGNHEAMQALAALVTQADDWRNIARMRTAQAEAAEARADQLHAELVEVKEAATALAKSRNELHARADQLQRERDELRAQVGRLELGAEALRLDVQKALARADQLQHERDEALLETSETRHEMGEWLAEERARRERAETALRAIAEDDELCRCQPGSVRAARLPSLCCSGPCRARGQRGADDAR